MTYEIFPIGFVRRKNRTTYLEILGDYRSGLKELGHFSHAQVFWWFHTLDDSKNRAINQFDPPFKAPRLGVFASRAPMRPNPIALSSVKIIGMDMEAGLIEISKIDAYDESPIIDIKAYMPLYNRIEFPKVPAWAEGWPKWMPEEGIDVDEKPR